MAWIYRNVVVFPAGRNGSGIRWTANANVGYTLRSETKAQMRQLIKEALKV